MKKVLIALLAVTLLCLFGMPAFAAGNYPSSNADWGIAAQAEADGSVTVTADASKVEISVAWLYVTVYDTDPGFTADSNMTGGSDTPFELAVVGPGGLGAVDATTYTIGLGTGAGQYNFQEDHTYYIVVLASDGAGWMWNYAPLAFTYDLVANTPAPTGEATPAPTENGGDTADLSMIAYAVATITGCGALALTLRRK